MAPESPEKSTELPETSKPNDIIRMDLAELDSIIAAIREDGVVNEREVIPYRVTSLRLNAQRLLTQFDTSMRLLETAERNGIEADAVRARGEIETVLQQLMDTNEMIANEIVILRAVLAYSRLQSEYKSAKEAMTGFKTDIGDAGRTAAREKLMDGQNERIAAALKKRARAVDLIDAYKKWFDSKGKPDEAKNRGTFEKKYMALVGVPAERDEMNPAEYSNRIINRMSMLEVEAVDELVANINHSRPAIAMVEKIYRTMAWELQGVMAPNPVWEKEVDDFIAAQQAGNYGGDAEVKAAVTTMVALRNNVGHAEKDIIDARNKLPKTAPEVALLLADLLESWGLQLSESKDVNAAARKVFMARVHASISGMLRLQQVYVREFSGFEHLRVSYVRPAAGLPVDPGRTKTLAEDHRGNAKVRCAELLAGMKTMREMLKPVPSDFVRHGASNYIVEPVRKLYKIVGKVMPGEDKLKTAKEESVLEILRGFDQSTIDDIEKTVKTYENFLTLKEMDPAALAKARAKLTPEQMQKLAEEALALPDMSPEEALVLAKGSDENGRIKLWIWLTHKLEKNLDRYEGEQKKLFDRLEKSGTDGKKRAAEFAEEADRNRQSFWWILYVVAGVVGVLAARKLYKKFSGGPKAAPAPAPATDPKEEKVKEKTDSERRKEILEKSLDDLKEVERLKSDEEAKRKPDGSKGEVSTETLRSRTNIRISINAESLEVIKDVASNKTKPSQLSDLALDTCRARVEALRKAGGKPGFDLDAVERALEAEKARRAAPKKGG